MELGILLVLIMIVVFMYKDVKWVVYLIGIIELFLGLIHAVGDKLGVAAINNVINTYLPTSILSVLRRDCSGLVYEVLSWVFIAVLILFLVYLVKYFIRKK